MPAVYCTFVFAYAKSQFSHNVAHFTQVIADLEMKHRQEMSDLIAKLEKEKEDSLQLKSSLTSLAGDKQVNMSFICLTHI